MVGDRSSTQEVPVATRSELTTAATSLHGYLLENHWHPPVISGPDPGIRWNARIGRFAKSYTPFLPWRDNLIYSQAQKYWIQSNLLFDDLGISSNSGLDMAIQTADYLRTSQMPEGYWEYPNPEWKDRIATVEGNYAAIGLLLVEERTRGGRFLDGAKRWYDYTVDGIGFQHLERTLAINYFGNLPGNRIPNNSASTVRVYAMLADATGDDSYLEFCGPMVAFMASVQTSAGELPYAATGVTGGDRPHFLCYQYNAFQFLNIVDYWTLTKDPAAEPLLTGLVEFLRTGQNPDGSSRYDCTNPRPEVVYYTGALAAALATATHLGMGDHRDAVRLATDRLLSHQRMDGGFPYSFGNYGYLSDTRSYPRYLSMILTHLAMLIGMADAGEDA
jgi:hypothetical protein